MPTIRRSAVSIMVSTIKFRGYIQNSFQTQPNMSVSIGCRRF